MGKIGESNQREKAMIVEIANLKNEMRALAVKTGEALLAQRTAGTPAVPTSAPATTAGTTHGPLHV